MNEREVITSQYLASLEMLKQTINDCPEWLWDNPDDKTKFWRVAYHALFYLHLYLQDTGEDFKPWNKHRPDTHLIGQPAVPPGAAPTSVEPYDKNSILEYLAFCQAQVTERVSHLVLDAGSGFHWLPFGKLELQIYNIRHLQQHTGELMERLGGRANIEIDWVAMKSP